jgi:hypothetical protein
MTQLDDATLRATADKLIQAHDEASRSNEWTFFVDELYARDCIYTCEYAGVMEVVADGIDQIKATHYGRDMLVGWEGWSFPYMGVYNYGRDMLVGWEGWTFPYMGVYTGTDNKLITHWMNRGPGVRADGSYFETPGISFITLNSDAKIVRQFDMFDLAHQMRLCDDLEGAGLLSGELKENWVLPMKAKLEAQLATNR